MAQGQAANTDLETVQNFVANTAADLENAFGALFPKEKKADMENPNPESEVDLGADFRPTR